MAPRTDTPPEVDDASPTPSAPTAPADPVPAGKVAIRINPRFWRTDRVIFGEAFDRLEVTHEPTVVDEATFERLQDEKQVVDDDGTRHEFQIVVKA